MSKILISILFGCLMPICLMAQKIKLETKTAKVELIELPHTKLENVKT